MGVWSRWGLLGARVKHISVIPGAVFTLRLPCVIGKAPLPGEQNPSTLACTSCGPGELVGGQTSGFAVRLISMCRTGESWADGVEPACCSWCHRMSCSLSHSHNSFLPQLSRCHMADLSTPLVKHIRLAPFLCIQSLTAVGLLSLVCRKNLWLVL